jgi:hypothetical protein
VVPERLKFRCAERGNRGFQESILKTPTRERHMRPADANGDVGDRASEAEMKCCGDFRHVDASPQRTQGGGEHRLPIQNDRRMIIVAAAKDKFEAGRGASACRGSPSPANRAIDSIPVTN